MATSTTGFSGGIQVPAQPGQGGGFRLISGPTYVFQLVTILASDCDSDNPFLRVGLGLEAVFANLSDNGWRAQQERKIRDVFRDLARAQIARLIRVSFEPGPQPAQFTVSVRYLDIETAREVDVKTTLRRS